MTEYSDAAIKAATELWKSAGYKKQHKEQKEDEKANFELKVKKIIHEEFPTLRKKTIHELLEDLSNKRHLSKKRKRLLLSFRSAKSVSEVTLKKRTKTFKSLASLLRDTNKYIKPLKIVNDRSKSSKPNKYYRLDRAT